MQDSPGFSIAPYLLRHSTAWHCGSALCRGTVTTLLQHSSSVMRLLCWLSAALCQLPAMREERERDKEKVHTSDLSLSLRTTVELHCSNAERCCYGGSVRNIWIQITISSHFLTQPMGLEGMLMSSDLSSVVEKWNGHWLLLNISGGKKWNGNEQIRTITLFGFVRHLI